MDDIVQRLRVKWQHRDGAPARKIGQLVRESAEAADEIEKLRELVRCLVENDPQDPISDGGHVVLDLWRRDARKALGMSAHQ